LIIIGCLPEVAPARLSRVFKGKTLSPKNLLAIDDFFKNFKTKFSEIPDFSSLPRSLFPAYEKYSAEISKMNNFRSDPAVTGNPVQKLMAKVRNIIAGVKSPFNQDWPIGFMVFSSGCLSNCTYCAIKKATGQLKSKPLDTCLKQYRTLLKRGYRHFFIGGEDPCAWGLDINSDFTELVRELSAADKDLRVTWELMPLNPEWIAKYKSTLDGLMKERKIIRMECSIQSGSDRILKLMHRKYTSREVEFGLREFKRINPDLFIIGQFIVGFPQETDADFTDTLNLIKKSRCNTAILHPYCDREDTAAARMDNKIDLRTIEKRVRMAKEILEKEKIEYSAIGEGKKNLKRPQMAISFTAE